MHPFLPANVPKITAPGDSTPSSRRPRAFFTVGVTLFALAAIAAVLVNVHPLDESTRVELLSKSAASLFKDALESQHSDLARHRAAEAKAKAAIHMKDESSEGGKKANAPLSDAALFRQALSSQKVDIAKVHAETKLVKQATEKKAGPSAALGSKQTQLSDAKLFQDALKSQRSDNSQHMASLKKDVTAEVAKSQSGWSTSKKAKQAKIDAELRLILGADDVKGLDQAKATTLKVHKARETQLTLMRAHAHHKALTAKKAKNAVKPAHTVAPAAKHHPVVHHAKPLAKVHAKPHAKAAHHHVKLTAEHQGVQVLNESAEKKLYEFLAAADGNKKHPKLASPPKDFVAKKKTAPVKKPVTKAKPAEDSHTYEIKTGHAMHGWAEKAMMSANGHFHMSHTAKSYRNAEFARSDAIENSLLSGPSGPSASLKETSHGRV